jgi:hypothetical protein
MEKNSEPDCQTKPQIFSGLEIPLFALFGWFLTSNLVVNKIPYEGQSALWLLDGVVFVIFLVALGAAVGVSGTLGKMLSHLGLMKRKSS